MSPADIPALRKRASGGDARSQFLLGAVYESGSAGISQDLREALRWFKQAAEQQIGPAETWVGDFYYGGGGIPVDYGEALQWYRRAVDHGDADASHHIAGMYEQGKAVTRDRAEAMKWYRKAADNGHNLSKFIVATHYEATGLETVTVGTGFQARGTARCPWESFLAWNATFGGVTVWLPETDEVLNVKTGDPQNILLDAQRSRFWDNGVIPSSRTLPDGTQIWWSYGVHMGSFPMFMATARRNGVV
jgi:hypothetical protein